MFIGHYALGLASRRMGNSPSLVVMFIAVQFLDLLWPIFVLLGLEAFQIDIGNTKITPINFTHYPYSHSMLMALVWSFLFGIIYFLTTKNRNGSLLLVLLVFSHWILDFLTHRPDLPLTPFTNIKVGIGLWNYPIAESILEFGVFLFGAYAYFKNNQPARKIAFWTLIAFLLIIHTMSILGPPAPSEAPVTWSANLMWLFVIWAWWIERGKKDATGKAQGVAN